jgi:hypothetical protein
VRAGRLAAQADFVVIDTDDRHEVALAGVAVDERGPGDRLAREAIGVVETAAQQDARLGLLARLTAA